VWETAKATNPPKPLYTQPPQPGAEAAASLAFSPDGKRLAGCVIDKNWLQLSSKNLLRGKVQVWDLAPEPRAQRPPLLLYAHPLPNRSAPEFVVVYNHLMLMPASKEGAIEGRDFREGAILFRLGLGKFTIGRMRLSSDRKWLAMEQKPPRTSQGIGATDDAVEIGVYESSVVHKATIRSCTQLLDMASGGKAIAVVREKQIQLWDIATLKLLKSAPFPHTRVDAAAFSPDGKLLAISHRQELALWQWEENRHERIELGRSVGSLAFSPDGRFLAEGPTSGENIQIREVETRKVVQVLGSGAKHSMNVSGLAYTQGGRVLIACDNIPGTNENASLQRINFWDTATGMLAHQITPPAGLPHNIAVTPNGRYLAALLQDGAAGMRLGVWRLDGEKPGAESVLPLPATGSPR
jgi:WD40 repeat protein